MPYSKKTPIYGFPVLGHNDELNADEEMRRALMEENLLLAGNEGEKKLVFTEGLWEYGVNSDGRYWVAVTSIGGEPAVTGLTGGFYFKTSSFVKWDGLIKGEKVGLYIAGSKRTATDPSSVTPIYSMGAQTSDYAVKLAELSFPENAEPFLDTDPSGKNSTVKRNTHPSITENPHGKVLTQSVLELNDVLDMEEGTQIVVGGILVCTAADLVKVISFARSMGAF